MTNTAPTTRLKARELKYWYIDRKLQKLIPWLARKIPRRLKYFVIIDTMVKVEPNDNPSYVSGLQMLEYLDKDGAVNGR